MKRINFLLTAACMTAAFIACEAPQSETSRNADRVVVYVDSIDKLTPDYTNEYWSNLDRGYQERVIIVQSDLDKLNAEEKARLEASIAKYNALKESYESKIREQAKATEAIVSDYKTILRNSLFGEGAIGEDMQFNYVTGANLHDVYKRFVNTVQDNKDTYSREDWDEIKVLWEALDTRKNEVEKDAPNGDNTKIAGLKIKFGAIKATNRPGTKGEENKKAKENS